MKQSKPASSRCRAGVHCAALAVAVCILPLAGCTSAPATPAAPAHKRNTVVPATPNGQWQGMSRAGKRDQVSTKLTIALDDASLHYGSPLQCTISAHYAGSSGSEQLYDINASNGGWCDGALAGRVGMTPAADGGAVLRLSDSDGQVLGEGVLPILK